MYTKKMAMCMQYLDIMQPKGMYYTKFKPRLELYLDYNQNSFQFWQKTTEGGTVH